MTIPATDQSGTSEGIPGETSPPAQSLGFDQIVVLGTKVVSASDPDLFSDDTPLACGVEDPDHCDACQ